MKDAACALESTQAKGVGKKSVAVATEFSYPRKNIGPLHR